MSIISGLRLLYGHLSAKRRRQLGYVFALMLIGAFAELATLGAVLPFLALAADPGRATSYPLLQDLFASFGWARPNDLLFPATILFAAVALGAGAVRLLLAWVMQRYVFRLGHDLGVEVYRRTLYQPYKYHVAQNTSELIAATNTVQIVVFSVMLPLMQATAAAVISVFILSALVAVDPSTAVAAAAGFGLMYLVVSYVTRRRLRDNSRIIAEAQSARIQTVQEGLGGIRDVLIANAQPIFISKFAWIDSRFRDAQAANVFFGAAPRFIVEACGMVLIAVLALVLSGEGGLIGALPVLGALALGAQRLLPLLQMIYSAWSQIAGSRHMLFDILQLLNLPLPLTKPEKLPAIDFRHAVALQDVSFRYAPDQPEVLKEISLRIDKGARVGFVGMTGSGKSTLIDLIMGLLEPTSGRLQVDGEILTPANVPQWRRLIAHVPQTIYLSDASLAENIAFGTNSRTDIDIDRVVAAGRKARLDDFIQTLPEGYWTPVGERGVRLSGGQRQRVGIARALYKDASVLVFDEATSALDIETEAAVMESIQSLGRELTVVLIAHRLSTLEICDMIIRVENGRVLDQGSSSAILSAYGHVPAKPPIMP